MKNLSPALLGVVTQHVIQFIMASPLSTSHNVHYFYALYINFFQVRIFSLHWDQFCSPLCLMIHCPRVNQTQEHLLFALGFQIVFTCKHSSPWFSGLARTAFWRTRFNLCGVILCLLESQSGPGSSTQPRNAAYLCDVLRPDSVVSCVSYSICRCNSFSCRYNSICSCTVDLSTNQIILI